MKSIKDGTYTLSPLRISAFDQKVELERKNITHIISIMVDSHIIYLGVKPTQEDGLVLMALGRMLNLKFLKENLLMENSFGLKTNIKDYYGIVCARGKNVLRLYKFDLTNSARTINRDSLLCKLSHIVKDGRIIDLVGKFLYSPIEDESGIEYNTDIKIPSATLITEVLLNLALMDFDKEFQRVFPQLDYTRYIHEVFVSFPTSQGIEFEMFEQQVVRLFDQLNLAGKLISIGQGDAPVPCYGGLVSLSQDGEVQVQMKF